MKRGHATYYLRNVAIKIYKPRQDILFLDQDVQVNIINVCIIMYTYLFLDFFAVLY